jgi:hypothetical protein
MSSRSLFCRLGDRPNVGVAGCGGGGGADTDCCRLLLLLLLSSSIVDPFVVVLRRVMIGVVSTTNAGAHEADDAETDDEDLPLLLLRPNECGGDGRPLPLSL